MGHTYRTGSGKTALLNDTINSTNHKQQGTKGSKYQTTSSKELSTKSCAEQEVGNGRGGNRPQQIANAWTKPCVPSIKKFPVATSANRTKRQFSGQSANQYQPSSKPQTQHQQNMDGRCTGNNKHYTHRGNIPTMEDFNRKYSSSTCTQEYNEGSHGCYQRTHRIDDNVVHNNGPYQG